MEVLNGLRPRENMIMKAMQGAVSKKILDTLDEVVMHEYEKK